MAFGPLSLINHLFNLYIKFEVFAIINYEDA